MICVTITILGNIITDNDVLSAVVDLPPKDVKRIFENQGFLVVLEKNDDIYMFYKPDERTPRTVLISPIEKMSVSEFLEKIGQALE